MIEVWKDIDGYEGLYEISNISRVKRLARIVNSKLRSDFKIKEKIMSTHLNNKGYVMVDLRKNNVRFKHLVHRLVLEAFVPKVENKDNTNHIDGVKTNNYYKNLEWCTQSENVQHAWDNGLQKLTDKQRKVLSLGHKKLSKRLTIIHKITKEVLCFESYRKAVAHLKVNRDLFTKAINSGKEYNNWIKKEV